MIADQQMSSSQAIQLNKFVNVLFLKQYQMFKRPRSLLFLTIGLAIFFLILTITTLVLVLNVRDIQIDYAEQRKCMGSNYQLQRCSVKFTLHQDMQAPIYLMYSVKNIYINHRRYLNSFSLDQIKGKAISAEQAQKECAPYVYNKDIPYNYSWTGQPLDPNDIASPCGIKPLAFFNDTFKIYHDGQRISVDRKGIYNGKTINTHRGPSSQRNQWIDVQNEHFKLHMLDGSLMTKRRVWGIIKKDLKAGNYELIAKNNYKIADLRIVKGIFLTTSTIIGGKQYFYPVAFGLACLACISFAILLRVQFRNYNPVDPKTKNY